MGLDTGKCYETAVLEGIDTDARVYALVGIVTIGCFAVGLVALARWGPGELGLLEVAPFAVGFLLFMAVYFVSFAIQRIEGKEGL